MDLCAIYIGTGHTGQRFGGGMQEMNELSRRGALKLGIGGLGLAAAMVGAASAASSGPFFKRNKLPIGLQLYTLGGDLRADLDGQLGQVAKIGYRTVEMAGYLGRTPQELRTAFDKAGLACTSSHVQAKANGPEPSLAELDRLIADAHVIGIQHIVLPMFAIPDHIDMKPKPGEDTKTVRRRLAAQITADDWKGTADMLNAKGKALRAAGLTVGYHNHNVEFAPVTGAPAGTTGQGILLNRGHSPMKQVG